MQIICSECRSTIELSSLPRDGQVICPACGSTFRLEVGDSTIDWRPGTDTFGRFKLVRFVGQGAFGTVYEARDADLDRTVAIKVPRLPQVAGSPDRDRFLREARSVAQLRHPCIASVHEVGQHEGTPYLVSDFIVGVTLSEAQAARKMSFRESAEVVAAVADALDYAHRSGVVHRDVKASNIMLDAQRRPFLMDFGLARRDAGDVSITADGQVLGTPAYMSPEQARGEGRTVDGRSDIYSLGVVLYLLLTGELPFRGSTRMLLHQVLNDEPRPPRSLNDRIPRDLETVCLKAMAKDAPRRYATAGEFADDLRRFLAGEPVKARPAGRVERAWRWVRRHPARAALGAMTALAMLALVGVVVSLVYNERLKTVYLAEAEARQAAEEAEGEARRREKELGAARLNLEKALVQTKAAQKETAKALGLANRFGYFHRVALADAAIRDTNVEGARRLLEECPKEHRGWEWAYLRQQCEAALAVLTGDSEHAWHQMELSPDGRFVAASDHYRGTVAVWDLEAGRRLWSARPHPPSGKTFLPGTLPLAISPDGKTLASGGHNGEVILWDLKTGKRLREVEPVAEGKSKLLLPATALAFDPVSGQLAVARVTRVSIVDPLTTLSSRSFEAADRIIQRIAYHPGGKVLAVAGYDADVNVWDARRGVRLVRFSCGQGPLYAVAYHPAGGMLATGGLDGSVRTWTPQGKHLATHPVHNFSVRRIAFRPDGTCLATASSDGTVGLTSLVGYKSLATYRGHRGHVSAVAFSPEGDRLVSAGFDGTVRVWDATAAPEGRQTRDPDPATSPSYLAFVAGGSQLLTGGHESAFQVRDAFTGRAIRTLRRFHPVVHSIKPILLLAAHPDASQGLIGISGDWAEVRDLDSGKVRFSLPQDAPFSAATYTRDGRWVVTGERGGAIRFWDAGTGGRGRVLEHGGKGFVNQLACSRDGRLLVSAGQDHSVRLWDLPTGRPVRLLEAGGGKDRAACVALSPDGRTVAVGDWAGPIRLREVSSGRLIQTLPGHAGFVFRVVFDPAGRRLISCGMDRFVRLWDLETGREAITLRGLKNQADAVDIDPTGKRVAASDQIKTIIIYSAEEPTPARQAERAARLKEDRPGWQRGEMRMAQTRGAWYAVEWFADRLIRQDDKDASLYAARGEARVEMGQLSLARSDLARAWKDPKAPLSLGMNLALLRHQAGDAEAHQKLLAEILKRHGGANEPQEANGVAWTIARFPGAEQAQLEKAEALIVAAIDSAPKANAAFLNTYGAVLFRRGQFKEAAAALEKSIRSGGGGVEDWAFLAMARKRLKQKDAPTALEKARDVLKQPPKANPLAELMEEGGSKRLRDLEPALLMKEAGKVVGEEDQKE